MVVDVCAQDWSPQFAYPEFVNAPAQQASRMDRIKIPSGYCGGRAIAGDRAVHEVGAD